MPPSIAALSDGMHRNRTRRSDMCLRFLRGFLLATCAVGVVPAAWAQDASQRAATQPAAVPLFNDRDFSGWRFGDDSAAPATPSAAWRIENGTLVGTGGADAILASQWDYGDFVLEFEWRAVNEDVDADVYVHAGRLLDADPLRIAKGRTGGPQENDRGEGFYNASATGSIGGGGSGRRPVPELHKPPGEWNRWRITAAGPRLALDANGMEAWTCTDHVPRRGFIGFRVFKGPLELRNLTIRETGFRSLMALDEWEVYPGFGGNGPLEKHWTRDGIIWTFSGPGPSIVTKKKDFRDYDLRLEFMVADPAVNSVNTGVYLRGVHPWQAEIWQHAWGSGLWGVLHVSARQANAGSVRYYPELGKAVRPIRRMDHPAGQWNYLEIRVEHDVVSTWLNGSPTVDRYPVGQVDPRFPATGGIGLQAHDPWKEVRFRDIRIRELP